MSLLYSLLAQIVCRIDRVNQMLARWVSWLLLTMVVVTAIVVVMRRGFDYGSIGLQESVTYMHGMLFLLSFAGCLAVDQHVRVDILYRGFTGVKRAWVNLIGSVLLAMPFIGLLIWLTSDYALSSWKVLEGSKLSGGLPMLFLLKTVVPLGFVALFVQIFSDAIYSLSRILGQSWPRQEGL